MVLGRESGGQAQALGGISEKIRGCEVLVNQIFDLSVLSQYRVLTDNPRRRWAVVVNSGTNLCHVSFADPANAPGFTLDIRGTFVIDTLNPWTGEVWVFNNAGEPTTTVDVLEVSLP